MPAPGQTFSSLAYVFRFRTEESLLGRHADEIPASLETETAGSAQEASSAEAARPPTLWDILHSRLVHLYAFWILIYVGLEVTIGGWIVTYIVEVRNGASPLPMVNSHLFATPSLSLTRLDGKPRAQAALRPGIPRLASLPA